MWNVGDFLLYYRDTFFISQAAGTDGITVLNLVLPVYNLIFAIGSMIGVGSATRYTILKAQEDDSAKKYFANAILCILIISIPFVLSGIFSPDTVMHMMGADAGITQLGRTYTRIFLLFTPFFMMNYVFSAFVRNDNAPTLAMIGTMMGSFSNVVLDYVFMFPMGMGQFGAIFPVMLRLLSVPKAFWYISSFQSVRAVPNKACWAAVPCVRMVFTNWS